MAPSPSRPPVVETERRHVTVLFCDVVGSTELASSLDAEELNDLMQGYYARCAQAIGRLGGRIASFSGDGILAVFGYPRAHEDAAERAVRAALDLRDAVPTPSGADRRRLRIRIGIATGVVVISDNGGGADAPEISVVGEVPNLAARLQAAAEPGSIVIAGPTRRLIGSLFALEPFGALALKGFGEPIPAWRVVGERVSPSRFEAMAYTYTEFVGREQEVELLRSRWHLASEGEGQVVLLGGEPGFGKSRIVETFRKQLETDGFESLRFQCSPHHVDSALFPLITWATTSAGFAPADPAGTRLRKLEAAFGTVAPARLALLAALLGLPPDPRHPAGEEDPDRRKEQVLALLPELVAARAGDQPVLLILEDAHWADPTTLQCFGRLIDHLAEQRALLIITHRHEFKQPWHAYSSVTSLTLNRLPRLHCQRMIEAVAGGKPLPVELVEQLIARTDGVPLFVEELTKSILESGLLQERPDEWVLGSPLHVAAIPETLHDSLVARLDRLASAREVAQIGAAIGREFSHELLAVASRLPDAQLHRSLEQLAEAGLVFPRGAPPAATYMFKHALVQEAAYQTMLRSRRVLLHVQLAEALERTLPDQAAAQPEIVAHHWTRAERLEPAVRWWRAAGDLAIRRSANREAAQHLRRALDLLRQSPEPQGRDAAELDLRIRLSGPLIATLGYVSEEVSKNYSRAAQLAESAEDDALIMPVLYGRWVIPYVRGDLRTALQNARLFKAHAERQSDAGLLMMGHRLYGSTLVWRGEASEGQAELERALAIFRAPDHDALAYVFSQHPRVAAMANMCVVLQHRGHFSQAIAAGTAAIAEAKRIGHFNSIAYALCFVGLAAMLRRDGAALRPLADELLQIARKQQAAYWVLWARAMLGWIAAREGAAESGLQELRACIEQLESGGAHLWVPQLLLVEAELLIDRARLAEAARRLDLAAELILPLDQRIYEAELLRIRARLLRAEDGAASQVAAGFDAAIAVALSQDSPFLGVRAALDKAGALSVEEARLLIAPLLARCEPDSGAIDVAEARRRFGPQN